MASKPIEAQVRALARMLGSGRFPGTVIRCLAERLHRPEKPHTHRQLEALLAVTLALKRARMWP